MAQRLGLTGGIGSGKSTVAALMHRMGAYVIDADAIARTLTGPHGVAIAAIESAFGSAMINADAALDREQMRALAFTDPTAKAQLERIVHPLVGNEMAQQTQQAQGAGAPCIVYDIPLLVESGHWRQTLDRILVVDCSEATQMERVSARNGLDTESIRKIIQTQASRAQRLAAADLVVFNDGITIDTLAQYLRQIASRFGL